jgi:hypothetical protein
MCLKNKNSFHLNPPLLPFQPVFPSQPDTTIALGVSAQLPAARSTAQPASGTPTGGPAEPATHRRPAEADGRDPPVIVFPVPLPASQPSRGRLQLDVRATPPRARGPARQEVRAAYLKGLPRPRRPAPRTLAADSSLAAAAPTLAGRRFDPCRRRSSAVEETP